MMKLRSNHLFLFLYILFIIYGSLFPLTDWRPPEHNLLDAWQLEIGRHVSRSDLLTNLLVYIPLGFLLSTVWSGRGGSVGRVMVAVCMGMLLSFSMEYVQQYLPARTTSPVDLLLNTVSTLLGALLFCWFGSGSNLGRWLAEWRDRHFTKGDVTNIGLIVLALWVAAQLAPFVPSLDLGDLKNGLKPLWQTFHDLSRFSGYRAIVYALSIGGLGAVLSLIRKVRDNVSVWLCFYCGMVLLAKTMIVGRQLSLEALFGLAVGVVMTTGFCRLTRGGVMLAGICSVAAAVIIETLRPDPTTVELHPFNWIPFGSQMAENVSGIGSMIDGLWPFAALGFFAVYQARSGRKISVISSGVCVAVAVFALEYGQSFVAGRYADITTVILAVVGWSIPLLFVREQNL